jgi:hypothetical protein
MPLRCSENLQSEQPMKRISIVCALACAGLAGGAMPAASQSRIQAGVLECRGGGSTGFLIGSVHQLQCWFHSDYGARFPYYALVQKLGLDIGFTQQSRMAWAVFAPTRQIGPGDLAGNYAGVSAGAAIGIGGSANALVGGSYNSFALQPVSIEGQTGLNVAAGLASLELRPAAPVQGYIGHKHRHRRHAHR